MSEFIPYDQGAKIIAMYTPAWMDARWQLPKPYERVFVSVFDTATERVDIEVGYWTGGEWVITVDGIDNFVNLSDEKMSEYYKVFAWAEFPQPAAYDDTYKDWSENK